MILEVLIVCITVYAIFGNYFEARAEYLRELAEEKRIDNLIEDDLE